ncbi:MAG: potassium transporter [Candidatus Babeliales bacterium]
MSNSRLAHFSAGRVILLALFLTISLGTLFLSLPMARKAPMNLLDLIFTATSATCVTGLFTVPLENFTLFGKSIILLLIQIGGLGVITLTLFVFSLFMNLGLATQLMAGRLLELESWKDIKKLLVFIITVALCVELIGAAFFFSVFIQSHTIGHSIFLALFHAVSFFCSAGITLFNNSMLIYAHNPIMVITAMILMLLGGIGFITLYEAYEHFTHFPSGKHHHFSLQSRIVLYGALAGILITALLLFIIENNHAFIHMGVLDTITSCFFHAISFRSSGLTMLPIAQFQIATLFLIMIVGFIGSAPGSTGSGIRTTTAAIYLAVVQAALEGHGSVNIFGRRIAKDQVNKAIAIFSLGLFWIIVSIFALLVFEPRFRFTDIIFETMCAFTNLGLSTGITPLLSSGGKTLIILSMIFGRIGALTLILALRKIALRKDMGTAEIIYPEERIMLS